MGYLLEAIPQKEAKMGFTPVCHMVSFNLRNH